ncbi:hypothetical protein C0995_002662 [Termitomyces sp. Mi166|nr:hypothetical protein C0995_002662 [Termitomyces sp. Mi166\
MCAARRAKVVAFVEDEADVQLVIKYARSAGLPIAIRGGKYSPAGPSSQEMRLAYVGGGALWSTVDKTAIAHELATVGGSLNVIPFEGWGEADRLYNSFQSISGVIVLDF